jgi:hypothetical protein
MLEYKQQQSTLRYSKTDRSQNNLQIGELWLASSRLILDKHTVCEIQL